MTTAVLGGAACVWDDFEALKLLGPIDHIVAVNHAGMFAEHVDVFATVHPELLAGWINERRRKGLQDPGSVMIPRLLSDHESQAMNFSRKRIAVGFERGGSSGLFGATTALTLWRDNVVLCGIPMDVESGHFFNCRPWRDAPNYQWAWLKSRSELIPRVRSMSGWTMGWLGRPDTSWVTQEDKKAC